MWKRMSSRASHHKGLVVVQTGLVLVLLTLGGVACEGTKTGVGENLYTSIAGQQTVHDTLQFSLTDPSDMEYSTYPVHVSASGSRAILIGEANNLRGTALLKFPQVIPWNTSRVTYDGETYNTEALTITPTSVAGDSVIQIRLLFRRYVTDPAPVTLEGWSIPATWDPADSVTAQMPDDWFTTPTAFSGDTLVVLGGSADADSFLTFIDLDSTAIESVVSDSIAFAIRAISPQTMAQIYSLEGQFIAPQLLLSFNATVKSGDDGAVWDTVLTRTYLATDDTYRLDHIGPVSMAAAGSIHLGAGAISRGYLRVNKFNITDIDSAGVVPQSASANSAVLEFDVRDLGNTFQPDSAFVQILELGEEFNLEEATLAELSIVGDRTLQTGLGFDTVQDTSSITTLRVLEIADLVNRWWKTPDENYGVLMMLAEENTRVDALEIVGARLIITTTAPPEFGNARPARSDGEEADQ
jgi:hypothetical protein